METTDKFSRELEENAASLDKIQRKLTEFEESNRGLEEELARLQDELSNRENETNGLLARLATQEDNHAAEVDEIISERESLRRLLEKERAALLVQQETNEQLFNNEIEGLNQKIAELNDVVANLQDENEGLKGEVHERRNELETQRSKFASLETKAQSDTAESKRLAETYEGQLRRMRDRCNEVEESNDILKHENFMLTNSANERANELELWKGRYNSLEKNSRAEIEELHTQIEYLRRSNSKELQEISLKHTMDVAAHETEIRRLKQRATELEQRLAIQNTEVDGHVKIRKELEREVFELKNSMRKLELEYQYELDQAAIQFEAQRAKSMNIGEMEVRFDAERTSLETELLALRQRCSEAESTVTLLQSENTRYNTILEEKMSENKDLKTRINTLEATKFSETQELRGQLDNLKQIDLVQQCSTSSSSYYSFPILLDNAGGFIARRFGEISIGVSSSTPETKYGVDAR